MSESGIRGETGSSASVDAPPTRRDPLVPDPRPFPGERPEPSEGQDFPGATSSRTSDDSRTSIACAKTLRYLSLGVVLLVLINIVNDAIGRPFWNVTRHVYLGQDDNASAWFSSILLIVAAAFAYKCFRVAQASRIERYWAFGLVAGLLAVMSCDEVARFHESLDAVGARLEAVSTLGVGNHAGWVWVGGPVIVVAFAVFFAVLRRPLSLAPGSVRLFAIGIGLIVFGGILLESTINWLNHDELQWLWNLEVIAEETMEMAGTMFIAYSFQRWLRTRREPSPA
jgi:hypothetical protein